MLLLHVWGPAFGLPSIDPECLAAITHLHNARPSSPWRLIPSNDPSVSPSNFLPALNHNGTWTAGYAAIVKYLVANGLCDDIDRRLTRAQSADALSYAAFLGAHAAALVDVSLYVSATNWAAATRTAYAALLPFPLTWTVPALIRADAVKRAEHLGLAELDADFDPNGGLHLSAGRDALPESFRRHLPARTRRTVQEEMTPEQAAAIRLFALAEDCLTVLDQLLSSSPAHDDDDVKIEAEETNDSEGRPDDRKENGAQKGESRLRSFPGTPISSLDCLLFAHLALMTQPAVPRSFLRECLDLKTPRLRAFVDDMLHTHIVRPGPLPWADPEPVPLARFGGRVLDSLVRHVPGLGDHYAAEVRARAEQGRSGLDRDVAVLVLGTLAAGVAAGYGVLRYRALQPFGEPAQTWRTSRGARLGEFGELGSMLSSALGPLPTGGAAYERGTGGLAAGGRLVDIDSDVD
ncbi:Metaxin-like protein [Escovopsis weberi]|uniref:Metaxin-like protein n=1 Tax=Escovopsis weberi TaxID=150374 RepID=A0A0M8MTX4_ESCWE|nr:Metaxin-like protein [Escovopsis weberi]